MKKSFILLLVLFVGLLFAFASGEKMQDIRDLYINVKSPNNQVTSAVKPDINFGNIPLYFVFNKGQVHKKVKFYAKASRYTLWLTKEGLVFDSMRKVDVIGKESGHRFLISFRDKTMSGRVKQAKYVRDVSRLFFLNANKNPEIAVIEETELRVNYFKGKDRSKWHCDIPTSHAILYKNLYKNIDLKLYGIEKQIEYDWIVKPGGNPEDICFEYRNVKSTRIDEQGNLIIDTVFGEMIHRKPFCYQYRKANRQGGREAERKIINAKFKKFGKNTYGFEVNEYDKNYELIIDPLIVPYSTYLGGNSSDYGRAIAADSSGNVYVTGYTLSTDFPTKNQYQGSQAWIDVFVTRIDTTKSGASSLIYSTYLGGNDLAYGYGIAADSSGNVYVTGYTLSTDFPTKNQYQGDQTEGDAFVTRIDTTKSGASSLIYSTYLGGNDQDVGYGIAADSSGNVYVTGYTLSTDFPTKNQYQGNQTICDVFVTRIDTTKSGASSLIYSTYLGGDDWEYGYGIAADSSGNVYVTGETWSTDFPTKNQYQLYQSFMRDAFVTRIDTTKSGASSLIYSTYLGGSADDYAYAIAADSSGNVYVTGETWSTDFPTKNQYQGDQTDEDAFVTRIDTTKSGASSLIYSTYLGGNDDDYGRAIAADSSGNVYVTGYTLSTDFPTKNQYQGDQAYRDAFVTRIDTTKSGASSLIYSTYLGGNNYDTGYGLAVDSSGNVYVTGSTKSNDFPTKNQYQGDQTGWDAFVTKLTMVIKDDLLGTWDGSGVWFRNSETGAWVKMSIPAQKIAAGDIDGDNTADLIGVWSSGLWVKYSSTGTWTKLCTPLPSSIASGEMDGDGRDDVLGTWSSGVWYKNSVSGNWVLMTSYPANLVATGDIDGDNTADLIGTWSSGLWVKYSETGTWTKLATNLPSNIASGDMNGDGRDDVLGTWASGVWYKDSVSGTWVKMCSVPAYLVTAGDIDGDGTDDLIGTWSSGLWVKYSETGTWKKICTPLPMDIDAGLFRSGWGAGAMSFEAPIGGVYAEGPGSIDNYVDLSSEGPGGWNFAFQVDENSVPQEKGLKIMMKIPGPGETGFKYIEQKNLVPEEGIKKKEVIK